MSLIGCKVLVLTLSAIACGTPPIRPVAVDAQSLSGTLAFKLSVAKREFAQDEAIDAELTLVNLTANAVLVRRTSLIASLHYEFIDSTTDASTRFGSVLAESFPGMDEDREVLLDGHKGVEEHVDLRGLFPTLLSRPGSYKLSFEYCEFEAADRCVESNPVEIRIGGSKIGNSDSSSAEKQ